MGSIVVGKIQETVSWWNVVQFKEPFFVEDIDIVFLDTQYKQHVHNIKSMCGVYECKKITLLLGMVDLFMRKRTSALSCPMIKVNCSIFSPCICGDGILVQQVQW